MKMRSIQTHQMFDAELTTEHPDSIPGPMVLKRMDTSEFIALGDCFRLPGTSFKKYDLLEISTDERAWFDAAGIMIV